MNWYFWVVVLEKTLESPLDCKKMKPVNPKGNQLWIFTVEAEAPIVWPPQPAHWKRLWCWERLREAREGDDRGRGGWMSSPTQWTWVCVGSGSWWTGRPGVLQSMELQRVGHDWVTELNWVKIFVCKNLRLSLMKGIYYKATRVAVREMGPHKTVTARSQERNGSWASSMIYRAHSRRKGPLGFKTALGNKYYFMATHWQFFSFLLSSLWFCYSA